MLPLPDTSRFWTTRRTLSGGVERFIEWNPPRYGALSEGLLVLSDRHINRPDLISLQAYGRDDLWWVILHYNGIADPFSLQPGDRIVIPNLSATLDTIAQMESTGARPIPSIAPPQLEGVSFSAAGEQLPFSQSVSADQVVENDLDQVQSISRVHNFKQPIILPFIRLRKASATPPPTDGSGSALVQLDPGFNFVFTVPLEQVGLLHFQLEVSTVQEFSTLTMSRITYASQTGWFYFDPYANAQAGGYKSFPADGLNALIYANQNIYYHPTLTDPIVKGNTYYVRWRVWVQQTALEWSIPAPIIV